MFIRVKLANEEAGDGLVNTDHIAFIGMAPDGSVQISMSNGLTFPVQHTFPVLANNLVDADLTRSAEP